MLAWVGYQVGPVYVETNIRVDSFSMTISRRQFTDLIREVALEEGYQLESFSQDWIFRLTDKSGRMQNIFGYYFDINGSAAAEICKEKAATSSILTAHKISNIHHKLFLNPSSKLAGAYTSAVFEEIMKFSESHGNCIVVKPLKGTGGVDVFNCRTKKEVEAAVLTIFEKEYGVAVCPFYQLGVEYRLVCLDGIVRIAYKKVRNSVVGDGNLKLRDLLVQNIMLDEGDIQSKCKAISELHASDLDKVVDAGVMVPIQWRHNLGLGQSNIDLDIDPQTMKHLSDIAIRVTRVLGIRFCSVDIAELLPHNDLIVVEVNSGVMMDSFISDSSRRSHAKAVYKDALILGFKM